MAYVIPPIFRFRYENPYTCLEAGYNILVKSNIRLMYYLETSNTQIRS